MAFLPDGVIAFRRRMLTREIVALYHNLEDSLQNLEWYALTCPCDVDCHHMPLDEIPRLRIRDCYFPGELDFYFVEQPLLDTQGIKLRWYCNECLEEISCGYPDEVIVPYPLPYPLTQG